MMQEAETGHKICRREPLRQHVPLIQKTVHDIVYIAVCRDVLGKPFFIYERTARVDSLICNPDIWQHLRQEAAEAQVSGGDIRDTELVPAFHSQKLYNLFPAFPGILVGLGKQCSLSSMELSCHSSQPLCQGALYSAISSPVIFFTRS